MICLSCDSERFSHSTENIEQEFRGVTLTVKTAAMKCEACGWVTVGIGQIHDLCKATRKAYEDYCNEKTMQEERESKIQHP